MTLTGLPCTRRELVHPVTGPFFYRPKSRVLSLALKWNEAVDAPFLAPLLSRRKAFDCLEITVADGHLGVPVAAKLLGESLQKISRF
jgi:hypothetical protein